MCKTLVHTTDRNVCELRRLRRGEECQNNDKQRQHTPNNTREQLQAGEGRQATAGDSQKEMDERVGDARLGEEEEADRQ